MSDERLTYLPRVNPMAVWDTKAGLVALPFGNPLPLEVAEGMPTRPADFTVPRLVKDCHIYFGFYPKEPIAKGTFLGVLDVTDDELKDLAVERNGRWVLDEGMRRSWERVETIMTKMYTTLLDRHELHALLPPIAHPDPPKSAGYCDDFATREEVVKASRRSLQLFPLLSAVCTFAFSLWLNCYVEHAFDDAFALLVAQGLPEIVLDHLKNSVVCDLSSHLRPGCFLEANSTRWGRILYRIGRAGAPIWAIWGRSILFDMGPSASATMDRYFRPDDDFIFHLRSRLERTQSAVVPHPRDPLAAPFYHKPPTPAPARSSTPTNSLSEYPTVHTTVEEACTTQVPPKTVVARSRQRAGETWEDFRMRMEKGREAASRTGSQQVTESREAHAKRVGEGLATVAKRSKAFWWARDDYHVDYYIRTPMDHADAVYEFSRHTSYQRFYWPHLDEWDYVDHIPRYPDHVPLEDRVGNEDEDEYGHPIELSTMGEPVDVSGDQLSRATQGFLEDVRQLSERKAIASEYQPLFLEVVDSLRLRHGFDVAVIHNSSTYLWGENRTTDSDMVHRRLNFPRTTSGPDLLATPIIDFHNTAIAVAGDTPLPIDFSAFPPNWDLKPSFDSDSRGFIAVQTAKAAPFQQYIFQQERHTVKHAIEHNVVQDATLYILRPSTKSKDDSTWFVATTDPTTVMFVLRLGLTSMFSIAFKLLERGIPFRTVEERDRPPAAGGERQSSNALRPKGWNPSRDDYLAYLGGRQMMFESYLGRSFKARGGLVGRMAAKYVADAAVTHGPVRGDEVVGETEDGRYFVDDFISEDEWDAVAGLYRISTGGSKGSHRRSSWWPTQERWMGSGHCADQWTPTAEVWYQRRLDQFAAGRYEYKDSKKWKIAIAWDRKQSWLLEGSRKIAAKFIQENLHPSFKWSPSSN